MTDTAHADATHAGTAEQHADGDHHPTEKQYWLVFLALVIITAAEVAWSYVDVSGWVYLGPLLVMMLVKFALVAGVFMHLYFDSKMLNGRVFWLVFASGLGIALLVFLAVFGAFEFEI